MPMMACAWSDYKTWASSLTIAYAVDDAVVDAGDVCACLLEVVRDAKAHFCCRHIAFVDMVRQQVKEGASRQGDQATGAATNGLKSRGSSGSVKLPADMPVYDAGQKL